MQKICIIIPCYNEFERFPNDVFIKFIETTSFINFILVNDGSTDNTILLLKDLQQLKPEFVEVLNLKQNSGKAEAVRQGLLYAVNSSNKYDYIGFLDADFSTPLQEIAYMIDFVNLNNNSSSSKYDIILGSRVKRLGSIINRNAKRHYLGRVFATFASLILKLPVYDTQCGAKLIASDKIELLCGQTFKSKWLFDIELLARYIINYGYPSTFNKIIEVPLNTWVEVGGSKIKFSYFLKAPFDLLKIKKSYILPKNE